MLSGQSEPVTLNFGVRLAPQEIGYFEGQKVTIVYRSAEGRYDRLAALASDLVVESMLLSRRRFRVEGINGP